MENLDFGYLSETRIGRIGRREARMRIAAAIITTGVVGAIGSGVSAVASSSAAGKEAQGYKDATDAADATQMKMYNQTRDDQAPYRNAGYTALNTITSDQANGTGFAAPFDMSKFYSDPGYQFTLNQGTQAINNSAAARGGVLSGGTLKALGQYTTGLANQTYGDAYNRYLATSQQGFSQLATVANMGQQSLNTTAQVGQQTANQISNTQYNGITGAANSTAAGYLGVGNAINSGLGAIGSAGSGYATLSSLGLLSPGTGVSRSPSGGYTGGSYDSGD